MNNRFVLDNNILVSALLVKNSAPFWVIKKVEEMGVILYSEATLLELNQVLNRKKFGNCSTYSKQRFERIQSDENGLKSGKALSFSSIDNRTNSRK